MSDGEVLACQWCAAELDASAIESGRFPLGPSAVTEVEWAVIAGKHGADCEWVQQRAFTLMPYIDRNGVLRDPHALAVIHAVERENCRRILVNEFMEPLQRFAMRMRERGLTMAQAMLVSFNVDEPVGAAFADEMMPGYAWDEIRAKGQVPYARGIAMRDGLQEVLDANFPHAGASLRAITEDVAILVADRGIVTVFSLAEITKSAS